MNLNTTFVVSAIPAAARAVLRRGCELSAAAGCARYRSPRFFERLGLPLCSPAPVTPAWHGLPLYLPPVGRQAAVERHRRGTASLKFHQANVIDFFS